MAKKRRGRVETKVTRRKPEPADSVARANVERAIETVETIYAQARQIGEWVATQEGGYGKNMARQAMEEFGLGNEDDVRKFCLLVDEKRGFRRSDLDDLIGLARAKNRILGLTSLKRLLAVRKRTDRIRLARKMVGEGWSQSQVEAEVRVHNGGTGPQSAGGRPPKLPRTQAQMLDEFSRIATRWRRYQSAVSATELWNELDADKRRAVEGVTETMLRGDF